MIKNLFIQYLSDTDDDFPVPDYETSGSSGLDIRAYLTKEERSFGKVLMPGQRLLIPTGFKIEMPCGYEGQIRSRSGLALQFGIGLANGVGTIDSDYRGPLGVIMMNWGSAPYTIKHSQRIAQLVIVKYTRVKLKVVKDLSRTVRNDSGFGSTGNF